MVDGGASRQLISNHHDNHVQARTRLKEIAQRQKMHAHDRAARAAKKHFGREALAVAEPRGRDTAEGILFLMVHDATSFLSPLYPI